MSFSRSLVFGLMVVAGIPLAQAQGIAWEQVDPAPRSNGARATVFGYLSPGPSEDPGFSPLAVVAREDGAYLVLPVNGGSHGAELGNVINPSWQRLTGLQILRLDESGQVLWKRFWNFGGSASDFVTVIPTALDDAELTPSGGLALRVAGTRGLFVSAAGDAQRVDASALPSACYPSDLFPAIDRAQLTVEGHWLVSILAGDGLPARACALDASGQLLELVDAPTGRDLKVLDFRPGTGFLIHTRAAGNMTQPWQDTRLRQGNVDRWSIDGAPTSAGKFGLSAAGDAWLYDGAGTLRVIRADGSTRTQFTQASGVDVSAWLANGDALLATYDATDIRRVSPDGVERWRVTRASTSLGLGDWQVVGDKVRRLALRDDDDGEVLTVDLATGALQVGAAFELGNLAAGALGPARHLTASGGEPETTWSRDISTCVSFPCTPSGVGFASTMDVRVFASAGGAVVGGPQATAFGFPTYARLREQAPAVVLDPGTLDVAHARYISNGEKEQLEVARLSEHGQARWRRVLEVPRFDAADAQLAFANGVLYAAASSQGPLASAHRLWAFDSQGQIAWERTLDEPYQQLTRAPSGAGSNVLCGLGYTQRGSGPWQSPRWRCYDALGNMQIDTRLTQIPTFRDVAISHVLGTRVFLRVLNPANESSTGVQLVAIGVSGATVAGGVNWLFEPLNTSEFVRVDSVALRGINLVTAPVYANASASRASALLVAAFDAAGNRLWQRRIDQALRGSNASQTFTLADTDGEGIVQVVFPPNTGPGQFPLRVCRLSAIDGAVQGCTDLPNGGRVGAMIVSSEPTGTWMWTNEPLPSGTNQLSLLPLTATGIGAPVYQQTGLQLRQTKSELVRFDRSWVVVEPENYEGVFEGTPPRTRVLMFQPGRLFDDGFEDGGAP